MSSITLTASMRSNLSSLKSIATQMDRTQDILSTGKKVNSAIDNATNFYQARALTNRAADLNALLDSMGQGIQTIQAATEGLEAATSFLEQATAVVNQVLSEGVKYQTISAENTADDIKKMIENGAVQLDLMADLVLDAPLEIDASNITINGNGHKISYTGNSDSLIKFTGTGINLSNIELDFTSTKGELYGSVGAIVASDGAEINISDVTIKTKGDYVHGVVAKGNSEVFLDTAANIETNGELARKVYNADAATVYDGEANTKYLQNQTQMDTPIVDAVLDYYAVSENDANFGKGTWYLPSIGELAEGIYAREISEIETNYTNATGFDIERLDQINTILGKMGSDATILSDLYWSSTQEETYFWNLSTEQSSFFCSYGWKASGKGRAFQSLDNCFVDGSSVSADGSNTKAKVGDIMYSDFTYSSVDDYDTYKGTKTAVGVIVSISEDGSSAKIMGLKDANVYSGWSTDTQEDLLEMPNFKNEDWPNISTINVGGSERPVAFGSLGGVSENNNSEETTSGGIDISRYQDILTEFDKLIADSSYQGVNLLKGADLTVTFNESRSNRFTVKGKDMSAENIGLSTLKWKTMNDVEKSINELTSAINAIRDFSTELGNSYSIIQTRQNFTEALTDVLETGADSLVLADMNEASAQYLMLQTRQQLAVNSLSLASQSAQSILKLF